jgi:hydroxymethylpyrimidine/phosphomethylpyrimidine kinase
VTPAGVIARLCSRGYIDARLSSEEICMALKTALTIGGSDSSGAAGIQADLKTFTFLGVYGMSAITGVAAQNTVGVKEVYELSAAMVARQIDAAAGDIEVDAVKTGMLGTVSIIEAVKDCLGRNSLLRYVCDPVMFDKTGDELFKNGDFAAALKKHLLPLATVVTPNLAEAAALTGMPKDRIASVAGAKDAARALVQAGAKAAVIKGIVVGEEMVDLLFDGREFLEVAGKTQDAKKTHGSGCAFSAAITASLAKGLKLTEAVDTAKQLVNMAIQYSDGQGRGISPVNVIAFAPKKK